MGDPRKQRKKYTKPSHPWEKARIDEENQLLKEYGLKNKREVWKARTLLRQFTGQAKALVTKSGPQAEKEKIQLLSRLEKFGYIKPGTGTEAVLSINIKNILDRRLQTVLFKKGLARTIKQARQVIVHRHVNIADKKITTPAYMVSIAEEAQVKYNELSTLSSTEHAERIPITKKEKKTRRREVRPKRRRRGM